MLSIKNILTKKVLKLLPRKIDDLIFKTSKNKACLSNKKNTEMKGVILDGIQSHGKSVPCQRRTNLRVVSLLPSEIRSEVEASKEQLPQ